MQLKFCITSQGKTFNLLVSVYAVITLLVFFFFSPAHEKLQQEGYVIRQMR